MPNNITLKKIIDCLKEELNKLKVKGFNIFLSITIIICNIRENFLKGDLNTKKPSL